MHSRDSRVKCVSLFL